MSVTILVVLAWVFFAVLLLRLLLDPTESDRYDLLKMRLAGYVRAKGTSEISSFLPLTPAEHEILLGTLKKVEAKNAAMVSVHAFFAGFLFSALASGKGDAKSLLYVLFLMFEVLFIVAAGMGVRQLDNFNLQRRLRRAASVSSVDLHSVLQIDLMDDLLVKERLHHFSTAGGLMTVAVAATVISTITMCEFSARDIAFPKTVVCLCETLAIDPVSERNS